MIKFYVMTLKRSIERQNYIKSHFSEHQIKDYSFFYGVDYKDSIVKEYFKTDKVKKYPNCFRCNRSSCSCLNNIIIPSQVGVSLSYANIMKKIEENNDDIVFLCEDDISFYKNIKTKIELIFNEAKKLNKNKPLLIRLGSSQKENQQLHYEDDKIEFKKNIVMSNPFFLVNREFAKLFNKKFETVYTTSDIFIHWHLPHFHEINHFTVSPQLAKELSYDDNIFESTIHPKNKKHVKKVTDEDQYLKLYNTWIK